MAWTTAPTVAVCKECGDDIWPADVIFRTDGSGNNKVRETLCEDCGKLYLDSQELGNDA